MFIWNRQRKFPLPETLPKSLSCLLKEVYKKSRQLRWSVAGSREDVTLTLTWECAKKRHVQQRKKKRHKRGYKNFKIVGQNDSNNNKDHVSDNDERNYELESNFNEERLEDSNFESNVSVVNLIEFESYEVKSDHYKTVTNCNSLDNNKNSDRVENVNESEGSCQDNDVSVSESERSCCKSERLHCDTPYPVQNPPDDIMCSTNERSDSVTKTYISGNDMNEHIKMCKHDHNQGNIYNETLFCRNDIDCNEIERDSIKECQEPAPSLGALTPPDSSAESPTKMPSSPSKGTQTYLQTDIDAVMKLKESEYKQSPTRQHVYPHIIIKPKDKPIIVKRPDKQCEIPGETNVKAANKTETAVRPKRFSKTKRTVTFSLDSYDPHDLDNPCFQKQFTPQEDGYILPPPPGYDGEVAYVCDLNTPSTDDSRGTPNEGEEYFTEFQYFQREYFERSPSSRSSVESPTRISYVESESEGSTVSSSRLSVVKKESKPTPPQKPKRRRSFRDFFPILQRKQKYPLYNCKDSDSGYQSARDSVDIGPYSPASKRVVSPVDRGPCNVWRPPDSPLSQLGYSQGRGSFRKQVPNSTKPDYQQADESVKDIANSRESEAPVISRENSYEFIDMKENQPDSHLEGQYQSTDLDEPDETVPVDALLQTCDRILDNHSTNSSLDAQ